MWHGHGTKLIGPDEKQNLPKHVISVSVLFLNPKVAWTTTSKISLQKAGVPRCHGEVSLLSRSLSLIVFWFIPRYIMSKTSAFFFLNSVTPNSWLSSNGGCVSFKGTTFFLFLLCNSIQTEHHEVHSTEGAWKVYKLFKFLFKKQKSKVIEGHLAPTLPGLIHTIAPWSVELYLVLGSITENWNISK